MKILFFDTETTGVPKDYKAPVSKLDNWPRLVQLAWIMYDDGELIDECDYIIKATDFEIPEQAAKIHGITQRISLEKGENIVEILEEFVQYLECSDLLVAHNIAFDEKIVGSEMIRHGIQTSGKKIPRVCTMNASTNLCKIPSPHGGYKWPKLQELHKHLFGNEFESAHNALNDIRATAKCYFEMKRKELI